MIYPQNRVSLYGDDLSCQHTQQNFVRQLTAFLQSMLGPQDPLQSEHQGSPLNTMPVSGNDLGPSGCTVLPRQLKIILHLQL